MSLQPNTIKAIDDEELKKVFVENRRAVVHKLQ